MDRLTLASVAAPFLAKGAEAFSKSAGETLGAKVGELCQAVADKFRGDSDAEETLALGKKRPDSKRQENALREVLAEKLEADPDFAVSEQRLVDELEKGGSRTVFDKRGQTMHGSQTNIAGSFSGNVLFNQFNGPVSLGGEAVDMRGSTGAIYKPSGPVNQQYRYYSKARDVSSKSEGQRRIKCIFLAANPKGTQLLERDKEIWEITAMIRA